ncbi:UNVERIFIED_CONTAM: hypothetical protein FKN15_056562 [Acipenser sinensis]
MRLPTGTEIATLVSEVGRRYPSTHSSDCNLVSKSGTDLRLAGESVACTGEGSSRAEQENLMGNMQAKPFNTIPHRCASSRKCSGQMSVTYIHIHDLDNLEECKVGLSSLFSIRE